MKRLFVIIALVTQFHLALSEENQNPFTIALGLIEMARYQAAISVLAPIAKSPSTDNVVRGRAWTLLGFAYKEGGEFQQARRCYEEALRVFEGGAALDADRAATLDYLGSLEEVTGNLPDAQRFLMKALEINQRLQDHARLSTVFIHLAGVEIERKRYREAKRYLQSAEEQEVGVVDLKKELAAELYETQGWLASARGKKLEAVEKYKKTLEAVRDRYGNQHPLTGWSYLLLGKAFADDGDAQTGIENVREGMTILENTAGTGDLRYLAGEVLYAKLLARQGEQAESERLASSAQQAIDSKLKKQCLNCTVSAWSFQQK
jgi:tetratricopeptide (TPR) repeat protein